MGERTQKQTTSNHYVLYLVMALIALGLAIQTQQIKINNPFRFAFVSLTGITGPQETVGTNQGIKVIGAGFPRTGTNSLKTALNILGFPAYHGEDVMRHNHADLASAIYQNYPKGHKNNETVYVDPLVKDLFSDIAAHGFQATLDAPVHLLYKQEMELYPDAKVLLTVRDPEKWYKSWKTLGLTLVKGASLPLIRRVTGKFLHFTNTSFLSPFSSLAMDVCGVKVANFEYWEPWYFPWVKFPVDIKMNRTACIGLFNQHIENVKSYVPEDKLLVYKVGEGWERLANFLEVPVPDVPFPRSNGGGDMKLLSQIALGYAVLWPFAGLAIVYLFWKLVRKTMSLLKL